MTSILYVLAAVGLFLLGVFAAFGFFVVSCIFQAKELPMDTSNRINHIRLIWFVLTRPELFVGAFPWLANDELDNLK